MSKLFSHVFFANLQIFSFSNYEPVNLYDD